MHGREAVSAQIRKNQLQPNGVRPLRDRNLDADLGLAVGRGHEAAIVEGFAVFAFVFALVLAGGLPS